MHSGSTSEVEVSAFLQDASVPSRRDGLSPAWQCVIFLIVLIAFFSRRTDMFLHAQFYAEDGHNWYAQAYNLPWLKALEAPDAGYLQTLPRLVACFSLLFPLAIAPLIMNVVGLVIQALPVTTLLSSRCRPWGPLSMRAMMAIVYVVMLRGAEVHVDITNAQWNLAILNSLLAFALPPRGFIGRVFDILLFLVGSVSGPFSIILFPLALFYWWKNREAWTLVIAGILAFGAALQLFMLEHFGRPLPAPLGPNVHLFFRMIGGDVILAGILGPRKFGTKAPELLLILVTIFGMIVVGYCARFSKTPLKLQILFTAAFLLAALRSPWVDGPGTLWQVLLSDISCRYWYYPTLLFLWSAVWCVFQAPSLTMRVCGYCVLLAMIPATLTDWRYAPLGPSHFASDVQRFESARPGEHVVIPLYPGGAWDMDLIKHAAH